MVLTKFMEEDEMSYLFLVGVVVDVVENDLISLMF